MNCKRLIIDLAHFWSACKSYQSRLTTKSPPSRSRSHSVDRTFLAATNQFRIDDISRDSIVMSGQKQPAGDDAKGALANVAGAFKSDGAVGGAFEKDGAIGSIGEQIGGPFSSDGSVGKNFTSDGAIGGTVHDTAESAETKVASNRVANQEAAHANE